MKTYHGKTNYNNLFRFFCDAELHRTERTYSFGTDTVTFTPLGYGKFRVEFKNDEILFQVHLMEHMVIPLHVTNIIDGIDEDTFVTGSKKIIKPRVMTQADERLYKLAKRIRLFHLPY